VILQELKLQAGIVDNPDQEGLDLFAKLIVQECANELIKWKNQPFPYDEEFGARLIKQHFGVEE
jgi:hypothetical protein